MSVFLIGETLYELNELNNLYKNSFNRGKIIQNLNNNLYLSYFIHFIQFFILIFSFHLKCIFINSLLILIRSYAFMTDNIKLTSNNFDMKTYWFGTNYKQWLYCRLTFLCICLFYHFWRLVHI